MKKRILCLTMVITLTVGLAGCNDMKKSSDGEGTTKSNITSNTNSIINNEPTTSKDDTINWVEPAGDMFTTEYDENLGGLQILTYEGSDTIIQIPAQINGTPVKAVRLTDHSSITHIKLPNGLTTISEYGFMNCSNLVYVSIPISVSSIGEYAFCSCTSLEELIVPQNVLKISSSTFAGASALKTVNFKGAITSIGENAFKSCDELESLKLPAVISEIGNNAFKDCPKLTVSHMGKDYTASNISDLLSLINK